MTSCNKERLFVGLEDFNCIAQVARHCDWNQLCIYIREQQNLSLLQKIGPCLYGLIENYLASKDIEGSTEFSEEDDELMQNLLCGGSYVSCNGQIKKHFGLNRVLVHYAYGAYIYRHSLVDTAFGVVQKVNSDSLPASAQDLRNLNKDHRNNAEFYFSMTADFICSMKNTELLKECVSCCDCVCSHCSNRKSTLQTRGLIFKNVTRQ